jgi:hypothetical protein
MRCGASLPAPQHRFAIRNAVTLKAGDHDRIFLGARRNIDECHGLRHRCPRVPLVECEPSVPIGGDEALSRPLDRESVTSNRRG